MEVGCRASTEGVGAAVGGTAHAVLVFMGDGFENLQVWRRARALCEAIGPILSASRASRDYELSQQLNRAAISIMSNIAEGHLRRSRRQLAQFLRIAAGSLGEVRPFLYLASDRGYIGADDFQALRNESIEIGRMLEALHASVERQGKKQLVRRKKHSLYPLTSNL